MCSLSVFLPVCFLIFFMLDAIALRARGLFRGVRILVFNSLVVDRLSMEGLLVIILHHVLGMSIGNDCGYQISLGLSLEDIVKFPFGPINWANLRWN